MNNKEEYFTESDGSLNYDKKQDGSYKSGLSPEAKETHFKPGNTLGGRPKGSKNRKTLRQELIDNGKFTPAEFLVSIVNDESANINQRIKAAEASAKYFDAALSSVELHTDEEHMSPFNVYVNLPQENEEASEETEEDEECAGGVCELPKED